MSTTATWFPAATTLIGAVLGFFASAALSWLNHNKVEAKELSHRQRERLEDLYNTLVLVRKDYQGLMGAAINKIHSGTTPPDFACDGVPPIIKAEMLVSLYFPTLDKELTAFLEARGKFGKQWAALLGAGTTSWPEQKKREKTSAFLAEFEVVDKAIESFQKSIAKVIKA